MRGLSCLRALVVAGGVALARLTQPPASPADLVVEDAPVTFCDGL